MKISVIGCGYLGAVHAAAMASIGHEVIGIDLDPSKIETLSAGRSPFHEPGLDDLLAQGVSGGRLKFSTEIQAARGAELHFIAVGTPQAKDSDAADLTALNVAVQGLLPLLAAGDLVVGKSTVPVGTAAGLSELVGARSASLVWNPEFLREGHAVNDTINPDRVVIGVSESTQGERDALLLLRAYHLNDQDRVPVIVTDYATSELVKGAANAFLATKISFINALADICDSAGANVTRLADALGYDDRIGRKFLNAGIGFGGGCLPKDIRAFAARAEELGLGESVQFLREVDSINSRRRERLVSLVEDSLEGEVAGKKIAVLGASFKPNSDDVRDSPALDVASKLARLGAKVVITDPRALSNAAAAWPELTYSSDATEAIRDAHAIVVATEWDAFTFSLDPVTTSHLTSGRVIIDGRNAIDASRWRSLGWTYKGMGR